MPYPRNEGWWYGRFRATRLTGRDQNRGEKIAGWRLWDRRGSGDLLSRWRHPALHGCGSSLCGSACLLRPQAGSLNYPRLRRVIPGSLGHVPSLGFSLRASDRWVGASRAGDPRPASGLTTPEVEVLSWKHPAAQHEARAGSQQVLGKHLLGEVHPSPLGVGGIGSSARTQGSSPERASTGVRSTAAGGVVMRPLAPVYL
jgi:hypothetical protein